MPGNGYVIGPLTNIKIETRPIVLNGGIDDRVDDRRVTAPILT